ncbi:protocadherin-16 [Hemicordylus capensis]|uniref:protocadherin-16 n=1 Tax=Hemicordylus capensis TaxID=884348 RepID=UPI0023031DBC|nr:protocadherin-16 [Hemicordylus capensis]XP_053163650.1 protocadherin-16 [Hemicordylus capensis]XP_053163651.1 protocadherin-16 [Hemicordylus capensis]XP_053163652.1 protocadherin-16 [Hemicordylus capensis]
MALLVLALALVLAGLASGQGSAAVLGTLDLQIDEEQPAGTIIGDISAGLPPGTSAYMYFISAQEDSGVATDLEIDENTGIIKTARVLDHESRGHYSFIAVTPEGNTVQVSVQVNDINDHAPTFPKPRASLQIPEHTPLGSRFPLEAAFDADSGLLNTQGYAIKGANAGHTFQLDTRRAPDGVLHPELVVGSLLDREIRSTYTLLLEAYDGGSPPRSSQMTLDVSVQDVNDNAPAFNQSRYHTLIPENLQPGSSIMQVFAWDADEGDNGAVVYEINRRQSDPEQYFTIDATTGVIKLNKGLDYELRKVHELVVQARDRAVHPEVSTAFVTIQVRDYNDNQPTMTIIFLSEDGSPRISEGAQPGQFVARISVSDPDYGEYANINVSLEGGEGKFALTTKDNIIYLICVDQMLDREERDSYELRVTATDSGTPPLRAESAFVLQVTDINDNPPLFDAQEYEQTVPEVVYPGSFVLQVTARDKDQGPNGEVRYSILHTRHTHSHWFAIDAATGIVTTASSLDYEVDSQPQLTVLATDRGKPSLSSTAVVHVTLQDVNDNEPVFDSNFYNVSLKENVPPGTCFLQITATDADSSALGSVSYSLGTGISSSVPSAFSLGEETGQLCTTRDLDRDEGPATYDYTVTAIDGGGLSAMAYVRVSLEDVNDNAPAFYPLEYATSISTQSQPGAAVLRVTAQDKDEGLHGRVSYHMAAGNSPALFALNPDTGTISLLRTLTGQAGRLLRLEVAARDGGGLAAQPRARVNISIVAGTVSPPSFERAQYSFTVPEDTHPGSRVGAISAQNPPGHSDSVFYSIASGDPQGYFAIDPSTGELHTRLALDHETQAALTLEVQARSGSPPAYSSAQVQIGVSDVNDHAPTFPAPSDSVLLPEGAALGSVVYTVRAEDRDSGANGQVRFEVAPGSAGPFTVEHFSGKVRLVGALQREGSAPYQLAILAHDGGSPRLSATFTLLVHVQAEDEHGPVFDTPAYRVEVREGVPVGTAFLQVRALARASPSLLTYHLRADGDATSFGLAPDTGWLHVRSVLDREVQELHVLTVLAVAGDGEGRQTGTSTVRVTVTDENDNSPRLSEERYFFPVAENRAAGSSVGRLTASDRDAGPNSRLSYRLLPPEGDFLIHTQTGELSIRKSLDREQQASYQLQVVVQDGGTPPRSATGTVYVTVLDENDNAPSFLHVAEGRELLLQVLEEKPAGLLVASLQAKDPDEGENGTIFYSLSGAWAERFSLHVATGELRTATTLRQSDHSEYFFTVSASDRGSSPRSTAAAVRIQVVSTAHLLPWPDTTVLTLCPVEGLQPGSILGSVAPAEPRSQGQATYMLVGGGSGEGLFVVDAATGDIYVAQELDYEAGMRHTLQVSVEDALQGYLSQRLVLVEIHVQDRNDHVPAWPQDPVTVVVSESATPGSSLFTFQALDGDGSGPNSQLHYRLLPRGAPRLPFWLDAQSGELRLQGALDREAQSAYLLVVEATDQALNASQRHSAAVTAHVFVMDENDNAPEFLSPSQVTVPEDQPTGFLLLQVVARDHDLGENGRVSYLLRAGNADGRFHLNPSTGALSIVRALDREEVAQHNLTVLASDHGSPRRSATQLLLVHVLDVNDEAPAFERSSYEVSLAENLPPGVSVLQLRATDHDLGANGQVSYGGVSGDDFSLDPHTGLISTRRPLDREEHAEHLLTVYARDSGLPPHQAKATVRVLVADDNDHPPAFERQAYALEVPENQNHVALMAVRATDHDAGENRHLSYRLAAGDPEEDFALDPTSGQLSTARGLDRERVASYVLAVEACDHGAPPRCAGQEVRVRVLDLNDNAPQFAQEAYAAEVPEDLPVGALVLQLEALDPDEGPNGHVSYFLANESLGTFQVEPESGRLTSTQPLDRERRAGYSFLAWAVDSSPLSPQSASVRVTVTVQDVNDHAPAFPLSPLAVTLPRNTPPKRVVATLRAEDHDAGANASILYRLATPSPAFAINSYTGALQLLQPLAGLSPRQRTLFVLASDLGEPPLSSTGVVVIHLQEESSRGVRFPRGTSDVALPENAAPGTTVVSIPATHTAGSSGRITYSLVSGNEKGAFHIQPSSGVVSVRRPGSLDFELSARLRLVLQAETPTSFGFMAVNVHLQDVNDNQPRFQLQHYVAFIWEAQGYDSPVIQVVAEDLDQGLNGQVTYMINQTLPMNGLYHINPQTGAITTAAILDREIWAQTRLVLTATDRGSPPLVGSATLTVVVMDVNDNSPTIPAPWEVRVPENALLGTEITMVTGNDVDCGPQLSYLLVLDSSAGGTFGILRYGGRVLLMAPLDYEQRSRYTLTVRASDSQHEAEANVTVLVDDVNDNAPVFPQALYQVLLPEHTPAGSTILTLSATDLDSGANGEVTYELATPSHALAIHSSNGTLFTTQPLLLEPGCPTLDILVGARDGGSPSLSAWTTVQIQVLDVNDHGPRFLKPHYNACVPEDLRPGTTLLTLEAVDADVARENAALDYAIISGNSGHAFQLEGRVGGVSTLVLVEPLDFEAVAVYNLTVVVSDRGVPQHSAVVPVVLTVVDVNDNPPLFGRPAYHMAVSESAAPGVELLRVVAHDPDSGPHGQVRYSISSGDPGGLFQLHPSTGALRLAKALDCEAQAQHALVVQASDGAGGHFALTSVTIEVKDVNDNLPYFPVEVLSTSLRENLPPGSLVTTVRAVDPDVGVFGELRYSLRQTEGWDAFAINSSSGELHARLPFDYERTKAVQLLVQATDVGNASATATVRVLVTGEDEYEPVFLSPAFSFEVPEGARRGQPIGHVMATDEDEGPDGVVLYSLTRPSPFFGINQTSGTLYLRMDSQVPAGGPPMPEPREMVLEVQAHGPLPASRSASTQVTIDVTHTSFGLAPDFNLLLVVAVAASLGVVVVLAAVAIVLALARARQGHSPKEVDLACEQSGSMQKLGHAEPGLPGGTCLYHEALPGYGPEPPGPYARGGSLDPSHSSGRGSAEAAEDDEIRMINECPHVASIASSLQEHLAARGPDSGIQTDADRLSDVSCEPAALDAAHWFKSRKGAGLLLPGQPPQLYREGGGGSSGAYLGAGCGLSVSSSSSSSKDYSFPEDGKPCVDGSLTAIVASDEELRGSYSWDYLLNWCPQFQPLASVFTEIARLKDESSLRQPFPSKPKPRIDPPPLITSVAHPGAKSVPPKPAVGRAFPHLSSLRRSPLSHEGSLSSAAMSPSFSPSLSPLAARSPVVSPFGVSQGPSASAISTEHSLETPEEAELRI